MGFVHQEPLKEVENRLEKTKDTVSSMTVRKALCEAMQEEMRRDPNVFLIGEEVAEYQGAYKVSQGLLEEFGPRRVIDTPISEYGFTGLGVGAAFRGLRPIVEFMSFNFSMQAIDHVINSAAKTLYMSGGKISCPIVFRGPNGAAASVAAQHSQCYASWYAHCPGLKVVAPYDAASAKGYLKAAIRDPNPVVFLENEMLYGRSFPVSSSCEIPSLEAGKARARILRSGRHVTLVAFSIMLDLALEAAQWLENHCGISCEVVDLCVLRPWDQETVQNSVAKTHHLICLEEGWPVCGIGAEIVAQVMETNFYDLDAAPVRISGEDIPLPYAKNLEALALPNVPKVIDGVLSLLQWPERPSLLELEQQWSVLNGVGKK